MIKWLSFLFLLIVGLLPFRSGAQNWTDWQTATDSVYNYMEYRMKVEPLNWFKTGKSTVFEVRSQYLDTIKVRIEVETSTGDKRKYVEYLYKEQTKSYTFDSDGLPIVKITVKGFKYKGKYYDIDEELEVKFGKTKALIINQGNEKKDIRMKRLPADLGRRG